MGNREVRTRLKIQVFVNLEKYGWDLDKRLYSNTVRDNYRYIFEIPDHVPDAQMIRWICKVRQRMTREGEQNRKTYTCGICRIFNEKAKYILCKTMH